MADQKSSLPVRSLSTLKPIYTQPVDSAGNVNSEAFPIFAQIVDTGTSSTEKSSYNTSATVAFDASVNHDYTVTVGKTFKIKKIIVAASVPVKFEVKVGPLATLVTKFVGFTSTANATCELAVDSLVEVTEAGGTETIRITITNKDGFESADLYSTLLGNEV